MRVKENEALALVAMGIFVIVTGIAGMGWFFLFGLILFIVLVLCTIP